MPRTLLALFLLLSWTIEARERAVRHPGAGVDLTADQWVAAKAIPFDTAEARSGLKDLAPLRNLVGNARVVSLGEATHGSREFFTMKHRVLEYLVEEMGFTVFAIEANLPEADAVDRYVLHGEGDPRKALAGMYFWTWNTAEVLDMIEWMREYNLRRGDRPPVRFRGFDAQIWPYTVAEVEKYLARVDPNGSADIVHQYDCIRPHSMSAYMELPAATRNACAANLTIAVSMLGERRARYTAASSAAEFENVLRYAKVIEQSEGVQNKRMLRDEQMAANVEWLADVAHPGEKLVLWAHNWHVAANGADQMGYFLRVRFGSEMVVFGFAFDKGSFNARGNEGLTAYYVGGAPSDGWEDTFLAKAGKPRFFLDLRNVSSPAVAEILQSHRTMWIVGAVFASGTVLQSHRWRVRMAFAFDVIIYIESVQASRLLPFD
jgi:erythromycin esterase